MKANILKFHTQSSGMVDFSNLCIPAEMTDIPNMTQIADRIAARLQVLGKNPSAVALEAGLGRSSVRDIMVGKVSSPRLDTLKKLTAPLECTLEYLTGSQVEDSQRPPDDRRSYAWYDPMEVVGPLSKIEIGVFRTPEATVSDFKNTTHDEESKIGERYLSYRDLRLEEHYVSLFEMGDASLEGIQILSGDILTVAAPREGIVPVKRGTVVVVRRTINDNQAEELSARFVDIIDGDIVLTSRSTNPKYKSIRMTDRPEMEEFDRKVEEWMPNSYFTDHGILVIEGVVVRITRQLPV